MAEKQNNLEELHTFLSHRIDVFSDIYQDYFTYHVSPVLQLSANKIRAIKQTKFLDSCKNLVEDKLALEDYQITLSDSVGRNFDIITWVISMTRTVSRFFPSENNSLSKRYFNEELQKFSQIVKAPSSLDEHTSITLSWWLPQLIEIISLGLCIRKLSYENKQKLCSEYNNDFSLFLKNTSLTIYFLSGHYLDMYPIAQYSPSSLKPNLPKLLHELQDKNRQHTQNIRRLLYEAKKRDSAELLSQNGNNNNTNHDDNHSNNSTNGPYIHSNYLDEYREELLLEPQFRLLTALCRVVIVKNEDDEISQIILRYLGAKNCLLTFIKRSIIEEVASTNTLEVLFRGESVATKLMSSLFFSKFGGLSYLFHVVLPLLTELNNWEMPLDSSISEENMHRIATICQDFLARIYLSTKLFHPMMRLLLRYAQQEVALKFPEMKQKVIGGFVFLRFICPALVSPVRFGLVKNNLSASTQRSIILVSRVLQCIANGTEFDISKGDLTKLNQVIENHRANMFNYFDTLADTSSIGKDMNNYKFDIPPRHIHADFRTIVQTIHSMSKDIKDTIIHHLPDSYPIFTIFTSLGNPSILKQVINCDNQQYTKVLLQICGIFSTSAIKHLFGFEKNTVTKSDLVHFQWYNLRSQNFSKIYRISLGIPFYKCTLHRLLENIFTFHDFAASLFTNWNEFTNSRKKPELLRKISILSYMQNTTFDCEAPFYIPEAWESWVSLQMIVSKVLDILLKDVLSDFTQTQVAKDALCLLIVQIRWTVTRLLSLQSSQKFLPPIC